MHAGQGNVSRKEGGNNFNLGPPILPPSFMLRCSMNNKARESYPATTRPSSVSVPAGVIIFESRRGRDTPAVTGIHSLLQQRGTAARPAFQDIRRTKRDVSTKRRH